MIDEGFCVIEEVEGRFGSNRSRIMVPRLNSHSTRWRRRTWAILRASQPAAASIHSGFW